MNDKFCRPPQFFLTLPPGKLERSLYQSVDKILSMSGGQWKAKCKGHYFARPADLEQLQANLSTGTQVIDKKKKYQAFFTPDALAFKAVKLANVAGRRVLEPSAGHGALADACLLAGAIHVVCVELDPEKSGPPDRRGSPVLELDFLTMTPEPFSRIVMNRPSPGDRITSTSATP